VRIHIRSRGQEVKGELRDQVRLRLRAALRPFLGAVEEVAVYLADVSGAGHRCRLVVRIPPAGRVVVSHVAADLLRAVDQAAARCRFAVRRHVKRRWARRVRAGQLASARAG
jgi:ribosome-associated translation inhibitor RaiA